MYIVDLLLSWGRGKAMDTPPNGYPSSNPIAKMMGRGDIGTAPMSPEEHERIDAVITAMRPKKPKHFIVIYNTYVLGKNDAYTAQVLTAGGERYSKATVRNMRINAEHYLEGKLEQFS